MIEIMGTGSSSWPEKYTPSMQHYDKNRHALGVVSTWLIIV